MSDEQEWRVLAEEASHEQDSQKLMEIVDALNRALKKKEEKNQAGA
ncbi:MAG: hypothetical protein M3O09_04940 [Acidobacteriota bacterium]|jgi:hypothetical protein|nr:hypothetical protein [Acidobacteriota bacterium]